MKSQANDQSTTGAQAESSPKGEGARRKRPSNRELAGFGLKPVQAFVYAELSSNEPPEEAGDDGARPKTSAERKEKQREQEEVDEIAHFDVKIPKGDQAVKDTIKAVAESARGDRQLYSAVAGMSANASLRTLVSSAADKPQLQPLMAAIVQRGDVRTLVEAVTAAPQLLPLMTQITQRADVRTLVEATAADQVLARALSDLVSAGSLPAETWAAIVGEINRMAAAGVATSVVADALATALRAPNMVIKSAEVNRRGGIRARLLRWILGHRDKLR
jgi:hypothetical protein